jgi:hypothetical protein
VGLLQDGWILDWSILEEELAQTDLYGRQLIESFHMGIRVGINCIFHEWKALEVRMLTPMANMLAVGATNLDGGLVGTQGTDQATSLVLTALAGTPSATVGPASVTISKVKAAGNSPIQVLYGPSKRTGNYRGNIYPYTRSGATGGISYLSAT